MDKLILIYVFVALLQAVTSETEDSQVLPKDLLHVEDDFSRREQTDPKYLLPTLPTDNEPSKLRNNSNMNDNSELQTASNGRPSSETENEPTYSSNSVITTATTKSISDSNNEGKLLKRPPLNDGHLLSMEEAFPSEVQHESDVNNSATSDTNKISDIESSQLKKQFQPLENRSADDESRGTAKESGSVSTGKEQFPQNKNAISLLQNQDLLILSPKYQPKEQLPEHNPNSKEQYDQNNTMLELLPKQLYQHDKSFKQEIDGQQQNQIKHINASQNNFPEWVEILSSKSKPQLLHENDTNTVIDDIYDDSSEDEFDNYTNSNASEENNKFYSYDRNSGSVKNNSENNQTLLSALDQQQQVTSNDIDIVEEEYDEENGTNDNTDEGSKDYNSADNFEHDNVTSYYNKNRKYNLNEKIDDTDSDKNLAKVDGIQSDKYDLDDIIEKIIFDQVKEEDSMNQTKKSNENVSNDNAFEEDETVYKTNISDSESDEYDLEDTENADFSNKSPIDDDGIDEKEVSAADSSDGNEAEERSNVDDESVEALNNDAVNSALLSGSHSENPQDTKGRPVYKNSEEDKSDWFYEEKTNDDDDEDYTENEVNKDGSEEYKDEDWGDDTEDDFDESKNHLADELAKQNKQPTAPTRMVLFYTWMIVAVLLIIIGVSTYQSRCRGFRFFGRRASNSKDDRKRLVEHEFV
ncbi:hypothetical protein BsWGS_06362 [Bradybaena similaris]